MNKKKNSIFKMKGFRASLACVCILTTVILVLNGIIMGKMESSRSAMEGQRQLVGITAKVDESLYQAECLVESFAQQAEQIVYDDIETEPQLKELVKQQQEYIQKKTDGIAFNVYVAFQNQLYMDNFTPSEDYILEDRVWYIGAKKNRGEVYISPPYMGTDNGKMCYSVSKLLSDGSTIVSVDYYMDEIQNFIEEMTRDSSGISLIVDEDGMILGHSNSSLVGKDYRSIEYADVVKKAYSLYGDSFVYKIGKQKFNVFADKTSYDWYLIVCVDRNIAESGISKEFIFVMLFIVIMAVLMICFFILTFKNKMVSERYVAAYNNMRKNISDEWKRYTFAIANHSRLSGSSEAVKVFEQIHSVTDKMSDTLKNIMDYEGLKREQNSRESKSEVSDNKSEFVSVVTVLIITSLIAVAINTFSHVGLAITKMRNETERYCYQTEEWVKKNKSIVKSMTKVFAMHPELVYNYDECVRQLNSMIEGYDDISVAYIVNPIWENIVIMSNGQKPTEPEKVTGRQWYMDTFSSEGEVNVSTPYIDDLTGLYCVTISRTIYDGWGNYIGMFAVDYYLDNLVGLFDNDFSKDGYAFLIDMNYNILNHPNSEYQMTEGGIVNAGNLCYRDALISEKPAIIKDYDGIHKMCLVQEEPLSGFSVVVIKSIGEMYGSLIVSNIILLLLFGVCITIVVIVMKRIHSIQNRVKLELTAAAESAEAASNAKSDFLAQMSHEIRTPINAVLGMNEMILRESDNSDIIDYAANIQNAGKTLLNVINGILDFSKIEDGKMEIVPAEYDTVAMINDLHNMIRDKAEKKDLLLIFDIDPTLPSKLYGDDVRIRQILINLLTNAVKYTSEGSVTLEMKCTRTKSSSNIIILEVAVRDTGIGIKDEDIENLFASFRRIDIEKNRNIEGTGLGIHIVQRLLTLMNSSLEVNSVYGKGSVFSFEIALPIADDEPIGEYSPHIESRQDDENGEFLYAPQANVLIVDDYELNLKVAAGLMKRCGIQPDTVKSGFECIERVKRKYYDIIFLDHMMPNMDGIKTFQKLKNEIRIPPSTKVIMMTANAVAGAKEEYIEMGFDDYLSKPIDAVELEEKLSTYLPRSIVTVLANDRSNKKEGEDMSNIEKEKSNVKQSADALSDEERAKLEAAVDGLNAEKGVSYCTGSKSFYYEILADYAAAEREAELNKYFAEKNWENYAVTVHSLKSTSRTLGLEDIGNLAEQMQWASEKEDEPFIRIQHQELMDIYMKAKKQIKEYLG